jgi:hypothetical protein
MKNMRPICYVFLILTGLLFLRPTASAASPLSSLDAGSGNNGAESLLIHTDRDLYIAGENLYFQLYMVPSQQYQAPSRIAYISLQSITNENIETFIVRFSDHIAYGSIYLHDTLRTGNYRLLCFTNRMRGYEENNYITKPVFIVNRFDETLEKISTARQDIDDQMQEEFQAKRDHGSQNNKVKIGTNRTTFDRRDQVDLSIEPQDFADSIAYLSVSVAQDKSYVFPDHAFSGIQVLNRQPGGIHESKSRPGEVFAETRDLILEGMVCDKNTGIGLEGLRVLLSTPDSLLNLQYAQTLDGGNFYFAINDFYLNKPLYLTLDTSTLDSPAQIEVADRFANKGSEKLEQALFLSGHAEFIAASQEYVSIQKVYDINHKMHRSDFIENDGFRPLVYAEPNYTVYPEMFEPLRDFREISRELLGQLRTRISRGTYTARMLNYRTAYQFFEDAPTIFLDAIPVAGISEIQHLGSEQVKRIEVQNYNWAYGDMRFAGIMAVFSRRQAWRTLELPASTKVLEGIHFLQPSFYFDPDHSKSINAQTANPDLRQLLAWRPNIRLAPGENLVLRFHTSDIKGNFLIRLVGVTASGEIFSTVSEITVK